MGNRSIILVMRIICLETKLLVVERDSEEKIYSELKAHFVEENQGTDKDNIQSVSEMVDEVLAGLMPCASYRLLPRPNRHRSWGYEIVGQNAQCEKVDHNYSQFSAASRTASARLKTLTTVQDLLHKSYIKSHCGHDMRPAYTYEDDIILHFVLFS